MVLGCVCPPLGVRERVESLLVGLGRLFPLFGRRFFKCSAPRAALRLRLLLPAGGPPCTKISIRQFFSTVCAVDFQHQSVLQPLRATLHDLGECRVHVCRRVS